LTNAIQSALAAVFGHHLPALISLDVTLLNSFEEKTTLEATRMFGIALPSLKNVYLRYTSDSIIDERVPTFMQEGEYEVLNRQLHPTLLVRTERSKVSVKALKKTLDRISRDHVPYSLARDQIFPSSGSSPNHWWLTKGPYCIDLATQQTTFPIYLQVPSL
jgi:hypothetical protein